VREVGGDEVDLLAIDLWMSPGAGDGATTPRPGGRLRLAVWTDSDAEAASSQALRRLRRDEERSRGLLAAVPTSAVTLRVLRHRWR